MRYRILFLCLMSGIFGWPLASIAHGGCQSDLEGFETLLEDARSLVRSQRTDASLAKNLRAAANGILSQSGGLSAASIPPVVMEGLSLAKAIDPGEIKPKTQWSYRVDFSMPGFRELRAEGAKERGMKRIFVLGAKGQLLANGQVVPSKAIWGVKIVVIVEADDERFSKDIESLDWLHKSVDRIGPCIRYMKRRQSELYTRLAAAHLPDLKSRERALEVTWITDHWRSFPTVPSSNTQIDFDYLVRGELRAEHLISFIEHSLGSAGNERIVGSVRSGGSRYSR